MIVNRRSPIARAADGYWRWVGQTLTSMFASSRRRRQRAFVVFGGCLTWLIVLTVVALAYILLFAVVTAFVTVLIVPGAVLSAIGGIDEWRLKLRGRPLPFPPPPDFSRLPPPPNATNRPQPRATGITSQ